jgi:hypothetical protein
MEKKFKSFGITEQELDNLIKLGLKYDKRQKKQMLAGSKGSIATPDEIKYFEQKIGVTLPQDYREFLLTQNGGIPTKSHVRVPNNRESVVQSIYSLTNPSKIYTIYHLIEVYRDRIPKDMLPIGDDPAGNLFLLGLNSGNSYGKVYFWDHEQEADNKEQPYYKNIYFVSNTFADFINDLC